MQFIKQQIQETEEELVHLEAAVKERATYLLALYQADGRDARTRAVARVQAMLHPPARGSQRASGKVRQAVAPTRARKARRPAAKSRRAK